MTGALLWLNWPVPAVRLRHAASGQELACVHARDGAPLRLAYVHSIYSAPAAEEFVVRRDALELVRLRSTSVPVLEYYQRREPIRASGADYTIEIAPERYTDLPVLVSALGQRTVHYDGRTWALPLLAADGETIRLTVERVPRLCTLWPHRPLRS
jgi:hypothetical protein